MAEAYHNEALRKQRVIDRALEARQRLELPQHKLYVDKAIQVGNTSSRSSKKKPSSAHAPCRRRVNKKIEAVRRDLHKQELTLRDSNLVMGPVKPEEELLLRECERSRKSTYQ